jgi:thiosulfate/3-mercaptopyruvate sulfurtransferase
MITSIPAFSPAPHPGRSALVRRVTVAMVMGVVTLSVGMFASCGGAGTRETDPARTDAATTAAMQRAMLADAAMMQPNELAELLSDPQTAARVAILDTRATTDFLASHIVGSRSVDLPAWTERSREQGGALLGDASAVGQWQAIIDPLGLRGDQRIVIVDAGAMTDAARVWFLLQCFGVESVSVLDGGYKQAGQRMPRSLISRGPARPVEPVAPEGRLTLRAGGSPLVEMALKSDVLEVANVPAEQRGAQVVDGRSFAEFAGTERMNNPRTGHIPGAISVPHVEVLDRAGFMLPPESLRKHFALRGVVPGKPIIVHCQGGGRSSLLSLALVRAGYSPVKNYYLSFAEWAADESCPLEK